MPAINIRDFPYELHRKLRLHAFIQGETMKKFITKAIKAAVKESEAAQASLRAHEAGKRKEEDKNDREK